MACFATKAPAPGWNWGCSLVRGAEQMREGAANGKGPNTRRTCTTQASAPHDSQCSARHPPPPTLRDEGHDPYLRKPFDDLRAEEGAGESS